MSNPLATSLDEMLASLRRRHTPLPYEIGAFIALEVVEGLSDAPAIVSPGDVRITPDGAVMVHSARRASGEESARSAIALLSAILSAAGPGVPTHLLTLVDSRAPRDLDRLRMDIEQALVPLNRSASRRVLARVLREAARESARPAIRGEERRSEENGIRESSAPMTRRTTDSDLDALLDSSGTSIKPDGPTQPAASIPPPRASVPAPQARVQKTLMGTPAPLPPPPAVPTIAGYPTPEGVPTRPSSQTVGDRPAGGSVPPPPPPAATRSVRPSAPSIEDMRSRDRSSPSIRISERPDRFDSLPPRRGMPAWLPVFVVLVVLGAIAAFIVVKRPDLLASLRGDAVSQAIDAGPPVADTPRSRPGVLKVRATPERAQILLFVGRGPATVKQLPLGVAHEFVSFVDGKGATRALVPPDAQWETTPNGPLYEIAMQVGGADVPFERLSLGETLLPQNVGAPRNQLGSVRVVTTPRGAKIYQVVGFSPEVTVEGVTIDEALELLVFAPDHVPQRVVVGPSDWEAGAGDPVANINITLAPVPAAAGTKTGRPR